MSVKAAMQPNAHILILAIAAFCHVLAGRIEEARTYAEDNPPSAASVWRRGVSERFPVLRRRRSAFPPAAGKIGMG